MHKNKNMTVKVIFNSNLLQQKEDQTDPSLLLSLFFIFCFIYIFKGLKCLKLLILKRTQMRKNTEIVANQSYACICSISYVCVFVCVYTVYI